MEQIERQMAIKVGKKVSKKGEGKLVVMIIFLFFVLNLSFSNLKLIFIFTFAPPCALAQEEPPPSDTTDPSTTPPLFFDLDGDGVEDSLDNCLSYWNPDQMDMDFDGLGDPCDFDSQPPPDGSTDPSNETSDPLAMAGTCDYPIPIEAGVIYFDTTIDNQNYQQNYGGCSSLVYDGPEQVYILALSKAEEIIISLHSETHDLFLLSDCHNPASCLAFGQDHEKYGPDTIHFSTLAPGIYYLIVDSPQLQTISGDFSLTVMSGLGTCQDPIIWPVGHLPYFGDTTRGLSTIPSYACPPGEIFSGQEMVHRLDLWEESNLSLHLEKDPNLGLSLFLLNGCDASTCVANTNQDLEVCHLPAGTYYVIIDSPANVAGPYGLHGMIRPSFLGSVFKPYENTCQPPPGSPLLFGGTTCCGINEIDHYGQNDLLLYSGPEEVYHLLLPPSPIIHLKSPDPNLVVFILSNIEDSSSLVDPNDILPDILYYVVVDGLEGACSTYELYISEFDPNDPDLDGISEDKDNCPSLPNPDQSDIDGDGIGDGCDNCVFNFNPDQWDHDQDSLGTACDTCPFLPNPGQAGQADQDGDMVGDLCDNCQESPNPDQMDQDQDGLGDVCEGCPDHDADFICDFSDNCPELANPGQENLDLDAWGDLCDQCPEVYQLNPEPSDCLYSYCQAPAQLKLTVLLQGFYDPDPLLSKPAKIKLELRDPNQPSLIRYVFYQISLTETGQPNLPLGQVLLFGVEEGRYYVVVNHPTHLSAITASPYSFSAAKTTAVDFSAWGTADQNSLYQEQDGRFSLLAGDLNRDGRIFVEDYVLLSRSLFNDNPEADLDGDSKVDQSDYLLLMKNWEKQGQVAFPDLSLKPLHIEYEQAYYQCQGDYDEDGFNNSEDNCPTFWNVVQSDWDEDGLGDECDSPPLLLCPESITIEAEQVGGTPMTSPQLADFFSAPIFLGLSETTIAHNAPPLLPLGQSTVTFTALDPLGGTSICQSSITVKDNEAPYLRCPDPIFVEQTGYGGTVVHFGAQEAFDSIDPDLTIIFDPPSGSIFPPGATEVLGTATDDAGNSTHCFFLITVQDTTAPVLHVPQPLILFQEGVDGVLATNEQIQNFFREVSVFDQADPNLSLTFSPHLQIFPVGNTILIFTATDRAGHETIAESNITILPTVLNLTISQNLTLLEDNQTYDGHSLTLDGCMLTLQGYHHFKALHLINGAKVNHQANDPKGLSIMVDSELLIDSQSLICADGLGLPGGGQPHNEENLYGQAIDPNTLITNPNGNGPGNGGSYGGDGGQADLTKSAFSSYGDLCFPRLPGSGGGGSPGGSGGGIISLKAQTLKVEGKISANGQPTWPQGGGGSGGSILIQAETLTGTGSIEAKGGSNHLDTLAGCGGGGRIAIHAQYLLFDPNNCSAYGGESLLEQPDLNGAAGTIWLQAGIPLSSLTVSRKKARFLEVEDTTGILIVDNNLVLSLQTTPLLFPAGSSFSVQKIIIRKGGSLVVSEGVKVKVEEEITMEGESSLLLQEGSSMTTPSLIVKESSSLTLTGTSTLNPGQLILQLGSTALISQESSLSSVSITLEGESNLIVREAGAVDTQSLLLRQESAPTPETLAKIQLPPLEADFICQPTTGPAPLEVFCQDHSLGYIQEYLWDFGDGILSDLPNPSHLYTWPGPFTITLTVKGPEGTDTKIINQAVTIMMPEYVDQIWPELEGQTTHTLAEDVVIESHETLLIKPGTTIVCQAGVGITIHGLLYAIGEPDKPILFTSGQESWSGLTLTSTSRAIISYSQFEKVLEEDQSALMVQKAILSLAYSTFQNNSIGLRLQNAGGNFWGNTLIEHTKAAIQIENSLPIAPVMIKQNLLAKNTVGLRIIDTDPNLSILENNFQAQALYHLENQSSKEIQAGHNWWQSSYSQKITEDPSLITNITDEVSPHQVISTEDNTNPSGSIYDQQENPQAGLVIFEPTLSSPDPEAPIPLVSGLHFELETDAQTTSTSLILRWLPVSSEDITGYRLFYRENPGSVFEFKDQVLAGQALAYRVEVLSHGQFGVTAFDRQEKESLLAITPEAPNGFSFTFTPDSNQGNVHLFWNPPAEGQERILGYSVYSGSQQDKRGSFPNPDTSDKSWVTSPEQVLNLEEKVTWYFSLVAYDWLGNQSMPSSEVAITPSKTAPSAITLIGGEDKAAYQMLSLPLKGDPDPMEQLKKALGEYNRKNWRIFRYNPLQASDPAKAYLEYPQITALQPGMAVWIISRQGKTINFSGQPVDTSKPYLLRLLPGWNQIGNPFPFPVSWDDILRQTGAGNSLSPCIYLYTGGSAYQEETILIPGQGYWVKNLSKEEIELIIPPISQNMPSASSLAHLRPKTKNQDLPPPPPAASMASSRQDGTVAKSECFLMSCTQIRWGYDQGRRKLAWLLLQFLPLGPRAAWAAERRTASPFSAALQAYQAQNFQEASRLFEQGLSLEPENAKAHLYLGLAYYQQSKLDEAQREFERVIELAPGSKLSQTAQTCLERTRKLKKRFFLSFFASLRYDDNIMLNPYSAESEPAKTGDWKNTFLWLAKLRALKNGPVSLFTEYDFYQSLHHELDEYNIRGHLAKVILEYKKKPLEAELKVAYHNFFLDNQDYLSLWEEKLSFSLMKTKTRKQELFSTYQIKTFPDLEGQDAKRMEGGFTATFLSQDQKKQLRLGYTYGHEKVETSYLSFQEHSFSADYRKPLPVAGLILQLKGEYEIKDFLHPNLYTDSDDGSAKALERKDDKRTVSIGFLKKLKQDYTITAQLTKITNHSNLDQEGLDKRYHRTMTTINLIKQW